MDKRKKQVSLCETAPAATAPEDRKVGVAAPKMFAFDAIFSQDDAQVSWRFWCKSIWNSWWILEKDREGIYN